VQPIWRKLLFGLMVVSLALPFTAMTAGASSADRLSVKITAPNANDKVNGFVNIGFIISPKILGTPAKRQDSPYRAYSLSYAQGADVRDDGAFQVWRIDGGTFRDSPGVIGPRSNRSIYVQRASARSARRAPAASRGTRRWSQTVRSRCACAALATTERSRTTIAT
jgi:hypothetical protein